MVPSYWSNLPGVKRIIGQIYVEENSTIKNTDPTFNNNKKGSGSDKKAVTGANWRYEPPACPDPRCLYHIVAQYTVCPGSSDPPEKILNIFASENEVYTSF